MKILTSAIFAMLLACSTGALAADGLPYVNVSGGVSVLNDSNFTNDLGPAKATFKDGFVVSGIIGYVS
jgi:hypothetical protein